MSSCLVLYTLGFWSANDQHPQPRPHPRPNPRDQCDAQNNIPSKYAKLTEDVVKWLIFEDYKKPKASITIILPKSLVQTNLGALPKILCRLGVKIRKLKVDFMTSGTWQ